MEESPLQQPELIGREEELNNLKQYLDHAIAGKGSTIFIVGEAGIGKTRLVSELIEIAESKSVQIIQGWCLAESLEPLMPIKSALREAGLSHLISGDPPPLVVSTYLMNSAGLLIAKSEREELDFDPDIFASMLKAVGSFVKDSMRMVDHVERTGGLNILGYKNFKIMIEEYDNLYLASVTKGSLSEFLVNDMREVLSDVQKRYGSALESWDGDLDKVEGVESIVSRLVTSGKYDGEFLGDDPKILQENLYDNLLLGIQRLSIESPLLLFLDDLQWADFSSLALVHYLARNTKKNKTLILGTYRPEDIMESQDGKIHQLETTMQNMNREDLLDKMNLERLGQADTEKVMESTLGKVSFEKGFLDKVYRETEGTPFFILEIVKLLVEDGAIAQREDGIWRLVTDIDKLDVPTKVYDVVKRRLDRLMKEQREILECASVVGEEFKSEVVGNIIDLNKLQLLKKLSEIEKTHGLIHYLKDRYRFDHSKVKEVLYNGIGEELRKEYHRIIGNTIAEMHQDNLDEVVSELAYHYYEGGDERAGEYLIKAGDQAKERYANQEAMRFYENALELIGVVEKSDVLEQLGDVLALVGEYDRAIDNFEKAEGSAESNEAKARMLRKISDVHVNRGDYDKSLEVLNKAKAIIKKEKTAETSRICMSAGYSYWKMGEYDSAMPLFLEALKIFGKSKGEQRDLGNALRAVGNIHLSKGDYDNALQYQEKSLKVMEEIGEQYGIAAALSNIGNVYRSKGELNKALVYQEKSLEIFQKLGDKWGIAGLLNNIGNVYYYQGDLARALEYYEQSLEIRQKLGDKSGVALSLNNIGTVHHEKGDLAKALEYIGQSLEIRQKIGDKSGIAFSLNNIGLVYLDKNELDRALENHEQSLEICLEIGDKKLSAHNYCGLAKANLKLGKARSALEHAEKAVGISVEIGARTEEGMSHRVLGIVHRENKDWYKAVEEFEKAYKILEVIGDKNELAKTFYEYALLFKAKGEPAKAKEHLEKALSMSEEMGMKLWAGKCRKALEAE